VQSWQPDPTGRHQYRWWTGANWSDLVADAGITSQDPCGAASPSRVVLSETWQTTVLPSPPVLAPTGASTAPLPTTVRTFAPIGPITPELVAAPKRHVWRWVLAVIVLLLICAVAVYVWFEYLRPESLWNRSWRLIEVTSPS
jgi:hypothetical protein